MNYIEQIDEDIKFYKDMVANAKKFQDKWLEISSKGKDRLGYDMALTLYNSERDNMKYGLAEMRKNIKKRQLMEGKDEEEQRKIYFSKDI